MHLKRAAEILLAALAFFSGCARSADMDPSCLVSFAVKSQQFTSFGTTMSCEVLEARRADLFTKIDALPQQGSVDLQALATALSDLDAQLKQAQNNTDWTGLGVMVSSNALATVSLGACVDTLGAGCAVAVVSKLLSVVGIVNGAASDADKSAVVSSARVTISTIRSQLLNSPHVQASIVRNQLVGDFNSMCVQVKQSCL